MKAFISKSFALLTATFILASCGGVQTIADRPLATYSAVVDAGSSGSRIYLYQKTPDGTFAKIEQLYTNKDAPHGISWYDGSQGSGSVSTNAGPAGIQPMLAGLNNYLSSHGIAQSNVTVNVLATAGMRLINEETSKEIYESIRNTITSSGFNYGQVGTISGQNEGLYSWADINFLQGNFHTNSPTQGIVEVGGASSQIAFVTTPGNNTHVVNAKVNGISYPVFSVSYLGLGQNQARQSMLNSGEAGGAGANVCYPNNTALTPAVYDATIDGVNINSATSSYTSACYGVYEKVIGTVSENVDNNYSIRRVAQQEGYASTPFFGISSVYFSHKDWGAIGSKNIADTLQDSINSNCTGTNAWSQVLALYRNDTGEFTQNSCANSTYIHAYLYSNQALGINPSKLTPVARINGQELTWTRGFLVVGGLQFESQQISGRKN